MSIVFSHSQKPTMRISSYSAVHTNHTAGTMKRGSHTEPPLQTHTLQVKCLKRTVENLSRETRNGQLPKNYKTKPTFRIIRSVPLRIYMID